MYLMLECAAGRATCGPDVGSTGFPCVSTPLRRVVPDPASPAIPCERRHRLSGQRRFEIRRVIPARCAPAATAAPRQSAEKSAAVITVRCSHPASGNGLRSGGSAGPPHCAAPPSAAPGPYPADKRFVVQAHGPRAAVQPRARRRTGRGSARRQSPPRSSPSGWCCRAVSPRAAPPGSPWRVTPMRATPPRY